MVKRLTPSVLSPAHTFLRLVLGQFCTKPGIVLLVDKANGDSSIVAKFKDSLVRAVENIPVCAHVHALVVCFGSSNVWAGLSICCLL